MTAQVQPAPRTVYPRLEVLSLVVVTGIAAVLRGFRPGLHQIIWDEVNLLFRSLRLARYGEWVWLSNRTSWDFLPGHSPFNNYVTALPYFFTTDPRAPRLLIALMGVIAVVIVYLTVRRYFGQPAAVIAGLLFAVAAPAVEWSRYVWNPNIAQPFLALYVLTGLLGYYEGKRWAQVVHWLAFSLSIQAHAGNVALVIPSLVLLVAGWRRHGGALARGTLLGWLVMVVSVIPWMIGLSGAGFLQTTVEPPGEAVAAPPVTVERMLNNLSQIVSAVRYNTIARGSTTSGGAYPPEWTDTLLWTQVAVTLTGAAAMLAHGARAGWKAFPAAFLALLVFAPLLLYPISPINVQSFYLMAIMFGAYPVQGIALGWLARRRTRGQAAAGGLVVVWAGLHVWLTAGELRWLDTYGWQQPLRAPMDTFINFVADWKNGVDEVAILVDTPEVKYTLPDMQIAFWSVVTQDPAVRIANRWFGQGMPLGAGRTLVVGLADTPTIPLLFGAGELTGTLADGTPELRTVIASTETLSALTFVPETISRFNNGARVLGLSASTQPEAGQAWQVTLIWQPEAEQPAQYQFSLRLVDAQGTQYGQQDFPSLDGHLWRAGDTVLNPAEIRVADNFPAGAQARIQVLMYTYPDIRNADAVDDAGNGVASWIGLSPVVALR